jgi:hypothetical protein
LLLCHGCRDPRQPISSPHLMYKSIAASPLDHCSLVALLSQLTGSPAAALPRCCVVLRYSLASKIYYF